MLWRLPRWALATASVVLIAGAGAALRWWPTGKTASTADPVPSRISVEPVVSLTTEDGRELFPSLSPDDSGLRQVTNDAAHDHNPHFTPDNAGFRQPALIVTIVPSTRDRPAPMA